MKPGSTRKSGLLIMLAVVGIATLAFISWDNPHQQHYQQAQDESDTIPGKRDRKVRDLDEAIQELEEVNIDMEIENAMKEVSKALKELDVQKAQLDVQRAMKEIDMVKMKADIDKAMKEMARDTGRFLFGGPKKEKEGKEKGSEKKKAGKKKMRKK